MGLRFIHHPHGYKLTKADSYVRTEGKRFKLEIEYFQSETVCFKNFEGDALQEVDDAYALWNARAIISSLPPSSDGSIKRAPVKLDWIDNQLIEVKDESSVG